MHIPFKNSTWIQIIALDLGETSKKIIICHCPRQNGNVAHFHNKLRQDMQRAEPIGTKLAQFYLITVWKIIF